MSRAKSGGSAAVDKAAQVTTITIVKTKRIIVGELRGTTTLVRNLCNGSGRSDCPENVAQTALSACSRTRNDRATYLYSTSVDCGCGHCGPRMLKVDTRG